MKYKDVYENNVKLFEMNIILGVQLSLIILTNAYLNWILKS